MKLTEWFIHLKQRNNILGINARNLDYIYTHNERKYFRNIDHKLICKEMLTAHDIPVPRTYSIIDGPLSIKHWVHDISDVDDFVIKPNRGFGGNGIILVSKNESQYQVSGEPWTHVDVNFHIKQILSGVFSLDNISDCAFVEQKVVNHPALNRLIPEGIGGVSDIRLIYQGTRPVMGMLRLPTRESDGKANLHQGGIGVGIDIETGLTTFGCHYNDSIDVHPETEISLSGHAIPYFDEILSYGEKITSIVNLGYLGIDFVCDAEHGPMILEVNARPGLNIQLANRRGLREVLR